jgi:hypothetical protein
MIINYILTYNYKIAVIKYFVFILIEVPAPQNWGVDRRDTEDPRRPFSI